MKAYLVSETVYYESSDVVKAFFDKQKAIDYINECAESENSKMQPDDKYRYKLSNNGLCWRTPLREYFVEEIEIE